MNMSKIELIKKTLIEYLDVLFGIICFFTLLVLINDSKGVFGGGDTYQHYLIAKESLTYPGLLLHHWGKPVFTLLTALFAQFGLFGVEVFNAFVICLTAILCSRLIKVFNGKTHFLVVPFLVSVPVVYQTAFSALTEPLFALFLVLSILLFTYEKVRTALILISFIPLVRNEGFIFLPLFFAALLWIRRWKDGYLLFTGAFIYSILGSFFYPSGFLWLFKNNPYSGKSYEVQGELLHYAYHLPEIAGPILPWVLIIALPFSMWILFHLKSKKNQATFAILIFSLTGYFAAHSVVWWKGITGSLGLLRIMMPIIPLMMILIFLMFDTLFKKKVVVNYGLIIGLMFICASSINYKSLTPSELSVEEKGWLQTGEFLKSQPAYKKLMHYNPAICYFSGRDLFNYETSKWLSPGFKEFGDSNLICWDSHFGAQEGKTSFKYLLFNKKLELLTEIVPDSGAFFYEEMYKSVVFKSHAHDVKEIVVEKETFKAEKNVFKELDSDNLFFEIYNKEILRTEKYANVLHKIRLKEINGYANKPSFLVISVENETGVYQYYTKEIDKKEGWQDLTYEHCFPLSNITGKERLKVYVWYCGKDKMQIDEVNLFITKTNIKG